MISWPGKISPAERPEVVSSIDLAPTILQAAGVDVPERMPGVNLLPVLQDGQDLGRERIFGESYAHDVADIDNPEETLLFRWVIEGRWKLLLTYDGKVNRYKPVHLREDPRPQLYDLVADPHETQNLAADHPQEVARLARELDQWWHVKERKVLTKF